MREDIDIAILADVIRDYTKRIFGSENDEYGEHYCDHYIHELNNIREELLIYPKEFFSYENLVSVLMAQFYVCFGDCVNLDYEIYKKIIFECVMRKHDQTKKVFTFYVDGNYAEFKSNKGEILFKGYIETIKEKAGELIKGIDNYSIDYIYKEE